MKTLFRSVASVALASSLLLPSFAQAAMLSPGDLIKASGDAVYYYSQNGKRLVFPNAKTYFTWYSDFSTVKTISDGELAAISLGGNATYRPGVKLVKITTDPKVYAVSAGGTLRWIQTEQVATALYGADWNKKVEDVADGFFINYKVGTPIQNVSDYSASGQTAAATSIDQDRTSGTPSQPTTPTTPTTSTTPTAPASPDFSVSVFKAAVPPGGSNTINVDALKVDGFSKVDLFVDDVLVSSCQSKLCSVDFSVSGSASIGTSVVTAKLFLNDTRTFTKTASFQVKQESSNALQLVLDQAMVRQNQRASVVVTLSQTIAPNRTDIYVDGSAIKACANGEYQCRWSDYVSGPIGSTHQIYARTVDAQGRTYFSQTETLTIGTTDSPSVKIDSGKSAIYSGENLELSATASDDDGIVSIDILKDGVSIKHCENSGACTFLSGPWLKEHSPLVLSARAIDTKGTYGTSTPVTVTVNAQ